MKKAKKNARSRRPAAVKKYWAAARRAAAASRAHVDAIGRLNRAGEQWQVAIDLATAADAAYEAAWNRVTAGSTFDACKPLNVTATVEQLRLTGASDDGHLHPVTVLSWQLEGDRRGPSAPFGWQVHFDSGLVAYTSHPTDAAALSNADCDAAGSCRAVLASAGVVPGASARLWWSPAAPDGGHFTFSEPFEFPQP